jgi:hypothetical protein
MYYNQSAIKIFAAAALCLASAGSAYALPESCNDFQKVAQPRVSLINRINGFQKKKPTAVEACKIMTSLVGVDMKILEWMEANKDWCQVPDEQIASLKQAGAQTSAFKTKACAAAVTQAKQIEQMKKAQAQGGSGAAPGSAVRLPQGAL